MKTNSKNDRQFAPMDARKIVIIAIIVIAMLMTVLLGRLVFVKFFVDETVTHEYTPIDISDDFLQDDYMFKKIQTDLGDYQTVATVVLRSSNTEYEDISFKIKQQTVYDDDVYGPDYLLNHNEDGSEGYPGQIFVESEVTRDVLGFNQFNTVVYGHNMKDGSAFGWVRKFVDEDVFNNYSYAYIYYSTGTVARYKIACVSIIGDDELTNQFNGFATADDEVDFISYMLENAEYKNENMATTDSNYVEGRYITLSTCVGDDTKRRAMLLEYEGCLGIYRPTVITH